MVTTSWDRSAWVLDSSFWSGNILYLIDCVISSWFGTTYMSDCASLLCLSLLPILVISLTVCVCVYPHLWVYKTQYLMTECLPSFNWHWAKNKNKNEQIADMGVENSITAATWTKRGLVGGHQVEHLLNHEDHLDYHHHSVAGRGSQFKAKDKVQVFLLCLAASTKEDWVRCLLHELVINN